MAESNGRTFSVVPSAPRDLSSGSPGPKNRRNFTSGSASRIKSRLTRSPKRRAGTPEPERRTCTDDSEKDVSDGEWLPQGEGSAPARGVEIVTKGKSDSAVRRFFCRRGKHDSGRSKSLEPKAKEPESEEDFEAIRQMHKTKEKEEEKKEEEKLIADSKLRVKEELKEYVPKEMPPLIVAPKEVKKRKRHKSLPLQESQSEEEKPKTPLTKTRTKIKRKTSTSEDDDTTESRRGSTKSEDENSDLKNRNLLNKRLVKRREKETSESEGVVKEKGEKTGKVSEEEKKESMKPEKSVRFFKNWFTRQRKKKEKVEKKVKEETRKSWIALEIFQEWRKHVTEHRDYYNKCMLLKNRCLTDLLILMLVCGCGGMVFRFTEGAFESFYKCGVKRVKRDFVDTLWKNSQYMLEEDWKSQARRKLMEFENQLHSAHEAGMTTYSGQKSWSFLNAVVYCLTIVTTIGYGHISPSTTTGRAITIIYAIFGIPMFLILLADFGKLFTRGIKFVWAFVRRLYYTGSCRRVRKTAPVQEVMKSMQIMYDYAKSRRLTSAGLEPQEHQLKPPVVNIQGVPETPSTPNWSAFEIDDEFNLPISVAITILLMYIFLGAFMYWIWEEWSFFESFYFVFISMSTIGFGDFVPQHPMYMMLSIVYLIFGLALTSMCINVVQEKLSDTFRQASAKLGTTIGLTVAEEAGIVNPEILDLQLNVQQQ